MVCTANSTSHKGGNMTSLSVCQWEEAETHHNRWYPKREDWIISPAPTHPPRSTLCLADNIRTVSSHILEAPYPPSRMVISTAKPGLYSSPLGRQQPCGWYPSCQHPLTYLDAVRLGKCRSHSFRRTTSIVSKWLKSLDSGSRHSRTAYLNLHE